MTTKPAKDVTACPKCGGSGSVFSAFHDIPPECPDCRGQGIRIQWLPKPSSELDLAGLEAKVKALTALRDLALTADDWQHSLEEAKARKHGPEFSVQLLRDLPENEDYELWNTGTLAGRGFDLGSLDRFNGTAVVVSLNAEFRKALVALVTQYNERLIAALRQLTHSH